MFRQKESNSKQNQTALLILLRLVESMELQSNWHNTLQDQWSVLGDVVEHELLDFSMNFLKSSTKFNLFEDGRAEWFVCHTCGWCHGAFCRVLFNFSILIYIIKKL